MLEDDPKTTLLFALGAVECHAKRIENLVVQAASVPTL